MPIARALPLSGALLLFAGACAGTPGVVVPNVSTLRDAGFQVEVADTREELAEINTLPPRQIVPQERNGRTVYVYADAAECRCAYVGTPEAYATLKRMVREKVEREQREAAKASEGAPIDWGFHSPFF
jgi:hypothetical protein